MRPDYRHDYTVTTAPRIVAPAVVRPFILSSRFMNATMLDYGSQGPVCSHAVVRADPAEIRHSFPIGLLTTPLVSKKDKIEKKGRGEGYARRLWSCSQAEEGVYA